MASSMIKPAGRESSKAQAAAPQFLLSVLATCSSDVPAPGVEGEATLAEQLSDLLQDKAVAMDELNFLYSYRYGFGIKDALTFVGFDGHLQDFVDKQKQFCVEEGHVSLIKSEPKPADQAQVNVESPPPSKESTKAKIADDETISLAGTESTTDAESSPDNLTRGYQLDSDSDVDVNGWQSLGKRMVDALDDTSDLEDEDEEASVDAAQWKTLGGRIASAFVINDDEEEIDIEAWHSAGTRFLTMLKRAESIDNDDD